MNLRVMFFDLETRKWAKDLHPNEEVGWDMLRRGLGGVSALAIYDTRDGWVHLYDDHTIRQAAAHLEVADVVVGYCSEKFDVPVVEGLLGRALRLRHHYDIYVEMARANAERGVVGTKGDFTLGAVSKRNGGKDKIQKGGDVRELIRLGQWGKVFNYCADDVRLTRDLFLKLCRDGGLTSLNGKFLPMPLPTWLQGFGE